MELEIIHGPFTAKDIAAIASLHKDAIPSGFLSASGHKVLEVLYGYIAVAPFCTLVAGYVDSRLVGFIAGTSDSKKMFRDFLCKRFFRVGIILIWRVFNLKFFGRVFETLLYPSKIKNNSEVKAELLSMAVSSEFRGCGVSAKMFKRFVDQQAVISGSPFKIVAGAELQSANRFYQKMGAVKIGEIEVHSGIKSYVYLYGENAPTYGNREKHL